MYFCGMLEQIRLDIRIMKDLGVPAACIVSLLSYHEWSRTLNVKSLAGVLPYSIKTLQQARTMLISKGFIYKNELGFYSTTTSLEQVYSAT